MPNPQYLLAFLWRVVLAFYRNQGFLMAGALAYYALLSLLPLLILSIIGLSRLMPPAVLLDVLGRNLDWLLPSQAGLLLADVGTFLNHRNSIGVAMFGTLLFFSASAFSVLEKAMAVVFAHRGTRRPRHFLVSALLPYLLVLLLVLTVLPLTFGVTALQAVADGNWLNPDDSRWLADIARSLLPLPGILLVGCILSALYLIVPVGRTRLSHACIGGFVGALLWELLRHGLAWYFSSISRIGVVYGSLASSVILLFSLEIAAILLLLGAQVIAELERTGQGGAKPC